MTKFKLCIYLLILFNVSNVYAGVGKQSIDQQVLYNTLKQQGIHHPTFVLRQALLESNAFRSNLCKNYNNLFGIRKRSHYMHFASYDECVTYYKVHIQLRRTIHRNESYYHYLRRIHYAEDRRYVRKLKRMKINVVDIMSTEPDIESLNHIDITQI